VASKRFSQFLRLERANTSGASGAQDPDTGAYTPPASPDDEPTVIYDDRADVQDRAAIVRLGMLGGSSPDVEALAFLRRRGAIGYIRVGDLGTIIWDDDERTRQSCEVLSVRRLDGSLELRYLGHAAAGASIPDIALHRDADDDWAVVQNNSQVPDGYFILDGDGDVAIDALAASGFAITEVTAGESLTVDT
jgi:hypothetical protein